MLLLTLPAGHNTLSSGLSLVTQFNGLSNVLLASFALAVPGIMGYLISQRRNVVCNRTTLWGIGLAIALSLNWFAQVWLIIQPDALWVMSLNIFTVVLGGGFLRHIFPLMPKLFALPSTNQLVLVNQVLQRQIEERKQAEVTLKELNEQLESRVEQRTSELRKILMQLQAEIGEREEAEAELRQSRTQLIEQNHQLGDTLHQLRKTQSQLIQSEKMSSLGQMVAGIAHEINNPINFISGNLDHLHNYVQALIQALNSYQDHCSQLPEQLATELEDLEIDFIQTDLPNILSSMEMGVERICGIVRSLRNFSRLDEAEMKVANIHEGINSTLMILHSRLKANGQRPEIEIVQNYDDLPTIECYPGQLNQVFMNLLANAIDALEEAQPDNPRIEISTRQVNNNILIQITDNGSGMKPQTLQKLFDPFYTTKPVGKGTGLGLAISYQIVVEHHHGQLQCQSQPNHGSTFQLMIPLQHSSVVEMSQIASSHPVAKVAYA